MIHRTRLKVRFHELDPYHHVNHAAYIQYFEVARIELLDEVGMGIGQLFAAGYQLMVTELHIRYLASAGSGDELEVSTEVLELRRVSSRWRQTIDRQGAAVAEQEIVVAATNLGGRPVRLPDGLADALQPYLAAPNQAAVAPIVPGVTTARLSTSDELDDAVATLVARKTEWARLDYPRRLALLAELRRRVGAAATEWVDASAAAKGIAVDGATAAEEWLSGPYTTLTAVAALHDSIARLWQGTTTFDPGWISPGPEGRTVVTAVPVSLQERLLFSGYTGEVWIRPERAATPLGQQTAAFYRNPEPNGRVCVVLGAGNISSIPVLDVLYKLFVEGQVVVLKMSPVLDHLGEIFEAMLQPLLAAGYLRIVHGGAEAGGLLTAHPGVDTIHITGSRRSHDAIVFGPGAERQRDRLANTPVMAKPVTSELGGVSPMIVVPGPWRRADLAHHAELVATSKLLNGGFNCISTQVLILPDRWEHTGAFVHRIEATIAILPPRPAYYPGSADRMARAMASHHDVVPLGGDPPRAHLRQIPAGSHHEVFDEEVFAPVLASTRLEHSDPADFLAAAVHFANHRLDGSLGANVLIHPETASRLGDRFTRAITDLRYGCVAINTWTGFGFAQPRLPWGGYQGEPILGGGGGSSSGTGVVHNALMFDHPEKAVVTGPFFLSHRSWRGGGLNLAPRPPWFVTNRTALTTARRLTAHATDGSPRRLPGIIASALLG